MNNGFSHIDEFGNAVMVDVTKKDVTERTAIAEGKIIVSQQILEAISKNQVAKGDVLLTAQVAGIMAAKETSRLIPLCHPLFINQCKIEFTIDEDRSCIVSRCTARVNGKTGVEMEALTGVSVSLLTIYDMCKALDKRMEITEIHLCKKTGGKSGEFLRSKE
ncbi:MAG: cyclic pyranopterin monophosphate synthase MoaC [Clostridiales bacterium]|nr:cyclic pyranopterin monophosphate synthase MoaC [Clostridiales bacterium]